VIYVERVLARASLITCDECGKLMRWPDTARVYARNLKSQPSWIEHTAHPPRADAAPA